MSSSLRLTPLSGESFGEPLCFLLEIDEARILLDCGWSRTLMLHESDSSYLEALRRVCTDLDAVLISHGDIQHLGALPHAFSQFGLQCPIYTTLPIRKLAQIELYDLFQSSNSNSDALADIFSLEDIDNTFDNMITLKYSQETHLSGRADGILITPLNAGHSLGGSIWKITKETEEIVYAVNYNHRREGHLNGTVLEAAFSFPSVLITDCDVDVDSKYLPRRKRDMEFFDGIVGTLRKGGNVLIPVDAPGSRTLEILFLLNQYWGVQKLSQFSLVYLSHMGFHVLEYAKSFIEWMSSQCQALFNSNRDNPFALKNVHLCYSMDELSSFIEDGPVVVLASNSSMESSFAQDVFIQFAPSDLNLIVFPMKPEANSFGSRVESAFAGKVEEIRVQREVKVPLEGPELVQFLAKRKLEKQSAIDVEDELESDSDEEIAVSENVPHVEPIFKRSVKLVPNFPMFMAKESKKVWDDYGEVVRLEDLMVEEAPVMESEKRIENAMDVDSEEEEEPCKVVTENITVQLKCSFLSIDFQGKVDWRSMKTILQRVSPQKLVLVSGDGRTKEQAKLYCEQNVCKVVHVPRNNQALVLTSDTSTFKVKLRDALVKNLRLAPVSAGVNDMYEVAYVDGKLDRNLAEFGLPGLKEIDSEEMRYHQPLFLGEVKLPDVRKTLALEGIESEFVEGILVCDDGSVNIRKVSENAISIRGCLSQNYFYIRNVLYSHFQVV